MKTEFTILPSRGRRVPYLTTGDLVRVLFVHKKINTRQILYAVKRGIVKPKRVGGRYQFAECDIPALRRFFNRKQHIQWKHPEECKPRGPKGPWKRVSRDDLAKLDEKRRRLVKAIKSQERRDALGIKLVK